MNRLLTVSIGLLLLLCSSSGLQAQFSTIDDIYPGAGDIGRRLAISRTIVPPASQNANSILLYQTFDASGDFHVKAYDGTSVTSITPPQYGAIAHNSTAGGVVYFQGMTAMYVNGQPWVTDGTVSGTYQLMTVQSSCGYLNDVVARVVNNVTYLSINETKCRGGKGGGATGISGMNAYVYKTDGTAGGTVKLKSWTGSWQASSWFFHQVGTWCLFAAGADGSVSLYRSNGTSKGTTALKSFSGLRQGVVVGQPPAQYSVFAADDGVSGLELWRSDGTAGGTTLVADIAPLSASSSPDYMTLMGNLVYFVADNGSGPRLYCYDAGTNTCTLLPNNGESNPKWLTAMNGRLYYSAWNETSGRELWVYDPSPPVGTSNPRMVADIYAGPSSGDPRYGEPTTPSTNDRDRFFAVLGDYLYFAAKTEPSVYTLWRSDGTTAEPVTGLNVTFPNCLTVMDGKLYFVGYDATDGHKLYCFNPANYPPPTPKDVSPGVAGGIRLEQNYPNPFNPTTVIRFDLPYEADVTLVVADAFGREVARICDGQHRAAGTHSVTFDARGLSSGVYFYRLCVEGSVLTRRMLMTR